MGGPLEFDEAKRQAEAWLAQLAGSAVRSIKRATVREALEAYLADLRRIIHLSGYLQKLIVVPVWLLANRTASSPSRTRMPQQVRTPMLLFSKLTGPSRRFLMGVPFGLHVPLFPSRAWHKHLRPQHDSRSRWLLLLVAGEALAESTDTNVVTASEDEFGVAIGVEAIGVYSPSQVRGFDPLAAGNARIEGMYVDVHGTTGPYGPLPARLVRDIRIQIGSAHV